MAPLVRITLEGLPERVQAIADALDEAVPGAFEWHHAISIEQIDVLLQGVALWEHDIGTDGQVRLAG